MAYRFDTCKPFFCAYDEPAATHSGEFIRPVQINLLLKGYDYLKVKS